MQLCSIPLPPVLSCFSGHGNKGGKGSSVERAEEKCIQDDLLAIQLGALAPHMEVMDLVDWCRKYFTCRALPMTK